MVHFAATILYIVLSLLLLFTLFILFVDRYLPNWIVKGPKNNHFDGRCFFFPGVKKRSPLSVFLWLFSRKPVKWPSSRPLKIKYPPPPQRHEGNDPLVTFIGHASTLLQWNNLNILIDPVYAENLGPKQFSQFNIKRVHPPGVEISDLPPIDLVLVSHNHYDHMDIDFLKAISSTNRPKIVTGKGCNYYLKNEGVENVTEIDWWETFSPLPPFTITYLPAIHSSNRSIFDRDFTLWGGFAISLENHGYLLYSADSGYGPHWKEIHAKLGSPRLAILPIGAYEPRWFMKSVHMKPAEMIQSMRDLSAKNGMAVHFGMFPLSDEGIDDPVNELISLIAKENSLKQAIWIPNPGESRLFSSDPNYSSDLGRGPSDYNYFLSKI